jgi:hypothetical protein
MNDHSRAQGPWTKTWLLTKKSSGRRSGRREEAIKLREVGGKKGANKAVLEKFHRHCQQRIGEETNSQGRTTWEQYTNSEANKKSNSLEEALKPNITHGRWRNQSDSAAQPARHPYKATDESV